MIKAKTIQFFPIFLKCMEESNGVGFAFLVVQFYTTK